MNKKLSICLNGEWKCDSKTCEIPQCPPNQVYSTKAFGCAKTCQNYKNYYCDKFYEGCTCQEGFVYNYQVKYILY